MTWQMKDQERFRECFIEHVDRTGASVAEIARQTGVSRNLLNKLYQRKVVTTNSHAAMLVARYFGQTYEEFVGERPDSLRITLNSMFERLSDDEKVILLAQMRGILDSRK